MNNGDGDSVYHSPATGTTPKKSQPSTSKSKREELSEIVQACTQDTLQAQIKVEEECVMGLNAQEAGGSLVHMEGAQVSEI